jgi:hypothetical protein
MGVTEAFSVSTFLRQGHIVKGDILNSSEGWFSKPIDKAVYLPQQYGGHWYELWTTSVSQGIKNHLMSSVIKALKEAGYN